jgi:tRNA modification GTPase
MTSTIFALATAPGRAEVAVIRLSGHACAAALEALGAAPLTPRRASLRRLREADGTELDQALVLWMPAPHSFTGEDCAELHLHGGAAVIDTVSARLLALGLAPAQPGEFTRRAFEAGKLDLIQAEAVADLVDAESEAQRRQALAQLEGVVSDRHRLWRDRLISVLAQLEAAVDFPDEELPEALAERTRPEIAALAAELTEAVGERRGERVRDGVRVALVGRPNAGKSSLFNALLGRDAAIVTPVAGTTRDVIEGELIVAGRRVILADLAGLRDTADMIEQEGVRRARAFADTADLRLLLDDSVPERADDLVLAAKSDLGAPPPDHALAVSAVTGEGITALRAALETRVIALTTGSGAPAVTRRRHREALQSAAEALTAALADLGRSPELAAEGVRRAARRLAAVTGEVDAEVVLDRIFASFCIGK